MPHIATAANTAHTRRFAPLRARGAALPIVMLMALLGVLLVLWAARAAFLGEAVVGNDADYQRALETAQALVRDAQVDIEGLRPDGSPCKTGPAAGCRALAPEGPFFPQNGEDFNTLYALLAARKPSCLQGICIADGVASQFWSDAAAFAQMVPLAARYGQFTGAQQTQEGQEGGPVPAPPAPQAWYWVEVLPFQISLSGGRAAALEPDADRPYVYRITAIAKGRKPGTMAVVQAVFVWKAQDS
ncbi:MAG: hypothetical protein LBV61_09475 [Burkholderiaceae bacterium]|jgi:type IV pilus assembly protein PilX|nr:hypothetical protein [Burkholderiaceae bacterium]